MCGRYAITSPPEAVRAFAGYMSHPNFPPRYNIAPTQPVPIVRMRDGQREFALVRWGLVPSWAKEVAPSNPLINARSETVYEKPSFRTAIRRRRCLFPADGFYEWYRGGKKREAYYVRRRAGGLYAMAGIWEHWQGPDGSELESAAILTTDANGTLRPIHHRMPVIVEPEDFDVWLGTHESEAEALRPMLGPAPDDLLETVRIGDRVNKVANDDPSVQEPLAEEGGAETDDAGEGDGGKDGGGQMNLF